MDTLYKTFIIDLSGSYFAKLKRNCADERVMGDMTKGGIILRQTFNRA